MRVKESLRGAFLGVQMFQHPMKTMKNGSFGFIQHIRVVSLSEIEEIKIRLGTGKMDFLDHSRKVIVILHHLVIIEVLGKSCVLVQYRQGYPAHGMISKFLKLPGQGKFRDEGAKFKIRNI
ncbi:MAG: hypothetical protein WA228_03650, partial [Desulfobaccales bacterium]